ncbi:alanine--tRNA ligase [Chloroflexota bacterium]
MTGDEIREAFLRFFKEKGHTVLPSSSLIPQGDPTLLLTTAGMVQIKPYFLGLSTPPNTRLASCQKCFRTTDIDQVGDTKHLTFFEMLGNFSVGDYFKREAIEWAWEFVTHSKWLNLPPDRLWISIFLDDDEAYKYWQAVGVTDEKIVRLGEEDNFWGPAGDSGPCGPCSEIHYDFGEGFGCGRPDCDPACDCARFSEIWNLVFTQYNQDKEGNRIPLPKPNIDTGMGLERVAAVMQGKASVYETDLFAPIVKRVAELAGKQYGQDEAVDRASRIVAEHARGIVFLIADGVLPGNEGRGYVLRRLLRRTSLFGRKLGLDRPFLNELATEIISEMGDFYPELTKNSDFIFNIIGSEEERFNQTLDTSVEVLEGMIAFRREIPKELVEAVDVKLKQLSENDMPSNEINDLSMWCDGAVGTLFHSPGKNVGWLEAYSIFTDSVKYIYQKTPWADEVLSPRQKLSNNEVMLIKDKLAVIKKMQGQISGHEIFLLHDTYGFPKELTEEIAADNDLFVDSEGFEREMERQRERARSVNKFTTGDQADLQLYDQLGIAHTNFVGYDHQRHNSGVVGLLVRGKSVDSASEGDEVDVILKETPFYGEMGGQVGDVGEIRGNHCKVSVSQSTRPLPDIVVHRAKVTEGQIAINDQVEAEIDQANRLDIARNHTATHLLQAALRAVLGEQVRQSGSLVAPDRLRFDFTHLGTISQEQLAEIQHIVNEKIRQNLPVVSNIIAYSEAISKGAIALFGEKYGDEVRVLEIGQPPFSMELCGGTHVKSTGEIGVFHIVSESGIGTGMRRIEAVTGRGAEKLFEQRLSALDVIARELGASPEEAQSKLSAVLTELDKEHKRVSSLESELARREADSLLDQVKTINGINLLSAKVSATSVENMREIGDRLKEKLGSGVIVLGAIYNNRPNFTTMVSSDLVAQGFNAGEIVKKIAATAGGGGGGKAELGQGSGKDKNKLDEALKSIRGLITG